MAVKHSARRYDIFDAAEMANDKAEVKLTTNPEGIYIRWDWDGKNFEASFKPEEDEEIILQQLFRAAIKMAKM